MSFLPPLSAVLLGIFLSAAHGEIAPAFTLTDSGLPGLANSSVAWGDMNNNGRLDLVLTGTDGAFNPQAQVWRNGGNYQFTNATAGLPGLPPASGGSTVWGDYDNDGYWDLLLTGFSGLGPGGTPVLIAQVWRNLGNGSFVNANAGLPGTNNDAAAWADFDNDGDLDLLLTGHSRNGAIAQIWRNDGPAGFVNINAGLTGVFYSSVALADFDNDGRIDILISGTTNGFINGALTQVWRNLGGGIFTNINANLPGVSQGAVAWGDFDNDKRLDILVTGYSGTGAIAQIWRNTGNGAFAITASGLPGVSQGGVATGDFDNDGNLDVLLSGVDAGEALVCEVWRNQGGGTFSNFETDLPGVRAGALAWADFNNDGRLDILLTGFDADNNPISRIYQNHSPLENTAIPLISNPQRIDDSDFQFEFNGKTGLPYLVWSSTNLADWNPIGAAREASPGHFHFRDSDAGSHAKRFYRTSSP
jgi:hypothetical protein